MTYQVLARSWRPQRFADLLGQEGVVQTLSNALSGETFGQAYLFSGLRGVGKTTVARLLAKAVNCEHGPTADPCGECISCIEVTEGASIDVIEIDGASNRGIDNVRELRDLLQFHPTRDRFRVIIIDEVHMLTDPAFNALLKSLEEPPPYILWIFATTERTKVPDTILSRCQQLEFRPVGSELIRGRLQEIAMTDGFELAPSAAAAIAGVSEGSVRDALSLLDQLRAFAADNIDDDAVAAVIGVPPVEITAGLLRAMAAGRVGEILELLRDQLAGGQDASVLYNEIGRAIRTALHLAVDPKLEPNLSESHRTFLQPLADEVGTDGLARMLGLWLDHGLVMRDSGNRELALEVIAMRLARWPSVRAVEDWLRGAERSLPAGPAPSTSTPPTASTGGQAGGSPPASGGNAASAAAISATEVGADDDDGPPKEMAVIDPRVAALEEEARTDPGVMMVQKVLGGDVVAVRPDNDTR